MFHVPLPYLCMPACPGATRCGYATALTAYDGLAFHHRISASQVWARGLGQGSRLGLLWYRLWLTGLISCLSCYPVKCFSSGELLRFLWFCNSSPQRRRGRRGLSFFAFRWPRRIQRDRDAEKQKDPSCWFKQPGAKGFVYFYSCAYDFTA